MAENTRVFKASKTAKSGLMLEEGVASLIGDKKHFISVDSRGITLRGPISIVATAESVRRGGLFTGLNDYLETIPSTIITPIPNIIPFPPAYLMVNIVQDLSLFLAMLV